MEIAKHIKAKKTKTKD